MVYIAPHHSRDGIAKVVYKGKRDGITEIFNALNWLVRLVTNTPNKGE